MGACCSSQRAPALYNLESADSSQHDALFYNLDGVMPDHDYPQSYNNPNNAYSNCEACRYKEYFLRSHGYAWPPGEYFQIDPNQTRSSQISVSFAADTSFRSPDQASTAFGPSFTQIQPSPGYDSPNVSNASGPNKSRFSLTRDILDLDNQLPGGATETPTPVGYSSVGQQLAQELDMEQSSRRSTLRKHYTPGDYVKYPSDTEGSVRRTRRTYSASNVTREPDFQPPLSPMTGSPRSRYELSRYEQKDEIVDDQSSMSRRYNYRSRSDIGQHSDAAYHHSSKTILDGPRPGPSNAPPPTGYSGTPLAELKSKKEALETLQRELNSLSRESTLARGGTGAILSAMRPPAAPAPHYSSGHYSASEMTHGGYASDSGYVNEAMFRQQQMYSSSATGGVSLPSNADHRPPLPTYEQHRAAIEKGGMSTVEQQTVADASGSGVDSSWTDELMRIAKEPMDRTLERYKRYNTSLSQIPPSPTPHQSDHL